MTIIMILIVILMIHIQLIIVQIIQISHHSPILKGASCYSCIFAGLGRSDIQHKLGSVTNP